MVLTFKNANPADIDIIQAIAKKTIDRSYRDFLDDYTVDQYLTSSRLEAFLDRNIKDTWVLHKNKTVLGFSICIDNVIDFIMIDVDYHKQGFGTLLLQHCEDLLFENHQIIGLESFEANVKASNFYIANNWVKTEKYRDPKQNAIKIIFRKQLFTTSQIQRMQALGG